MAVFVLVHGAWHGGWSWHPVAARLRTLGHRVLAPSLSGLADRAHLGGAHIGLETHVLDIAELIQFEGLEWVTLVGHSYGGIVARAVADRLPGRIERIVYLDALIPADGETAADLVGPEIAADWTIRANPDDWSIRPSDVSRWGLVDPAQHAWASKRVSNHPARTLYDPVRLSNAEARSIPVTCVHCRGIDGRRRWPAHLRRIASQDHVNVVEVSAEHDVMVTHPEIVVRLLHEGYRES